MTENDDAPQGEWVDKPPSEPAPPASAPGQASSDPQSPAPSAGDNPPAATSGFDTQAYLSTLPEDERAAKAALPPHILEAESKRGMLRSTFDRKRGEEAGKLRALEQQNQLLSQQVQQLTTLMERTAPPAEPQATPDDLAREAYNASSEEEYADRFNRAVAAQVSQIVPQAIEQHPDFRQLRTGVALRQARSSAPDFEEADYRAAQQSLERDISAQGGDMTMLTPEAIRALLPSHLRAARAERLLEHRGNGETRAQAPAAPTGQVPTLPISGSGASVTTQPQGAGSEYGPESTLQQRMEATLKQAGITSEQLAQLAQNF